MIYAVCQWGMLVVLAKLGTPETVGQFALGLAVTAPVIMLANLGLRSVQATDARQIYTFGHYLGLRLVSVILALIVIILIAAFSNYPTSTALVVITIGLAKVCEAISNIYYGLFQQHERMDRVALSKIIKGLTSLVALGLGMWLTGEVFWATVGLAATWAALLLMFDMRSGRWILERRYGEHTSDGKSRLRPNFDIQHLLTLAWMALPLGIVLMLISLNTNIPRYFIEHQLGAHELGIYAALAYLIVAGNMIIDALGQSASPRLARYYTAGQRKKYQELILKLNGMALGIGILAVLGTLMLGQQIVTLLYDAEYTQPGLLVLLMVVATVSYVAAFLGHGVTAARYFRVQLPILIGTVASTTIASSLLIPHWGLHGAALALLIGTCVRCIGYAGVLVYAIQRITVPDNNPSVNSSKAGA
jgi:O-antigen/teichoic acid export membrane protein